MSLIDLEVNHYLNYNLISFSLCKLFIIFFNRYPQERLSPFLHPKTTFKISLLFVSSSSKICLEIMRDKKEKRKKNLLHLSSDKSTSCDISPFLLLFFLFHPKKEKKSFLVLLSKWMEIKMKLKINREERGKIFFPSLISW